MIRRIIQIDEEKCNGCGACAAACHESAIGMVDGKAKLLRDDYCDGLGDCLPACPTGAITFVEREAAAYDEVAVFANQKKAMQEKKNQKIAQGHAASLHASGGCPGSRMRQMKRETNETEIPAAATKPQSQLQQWPVQIKLVPAKCPIFRRRETPDCGRLYGLCLCKLP